MESKETDNLTVGDIEMEMKNAEEDSECSVERKTWRHKGEFILALVGYSVGLGNVWRFPYLCYSNGGGAFLIPYIIFVIFAGIPMFFLEISLGQFTRQSAIGVWKLVPSMKGVGYGSAVINALLCIYYVLVMAWAALYLVHSCLPGPLPWTTCGNWWNTAACVSRWDGTNSTANVTFNMSLSDQLKNSTSPEQEFWTNYVLRQSSGLEEMGRLNNWPMILCFLGSWIIIYFCIFKGVRSTGRVVWVTATLPYIMLFILLVCGLTLDGAGTGIMYLLKPDFSKLLTAKVWADAGSQIFYSYGICFTVLFTFGSYNPFHNNCYRQACILATTCSLTSLLASLAIFSILGHMALVESKSIEEVATQGPGLAFLVYPTGLALLPVPRLWTILFFITLLMVGIDTQFSGVEGTVAIILERFPALGRGKHGREKASALISLLMLILGIPLLSNGGVYLFELYNMYAVGGICLLFVAFFESFAIGWIYGVDRYFDNIKEMIGYYPNAYFKWCYRFIIPILTTLVFLSYCIKYRPLELDGYVYPTWANAIGWILSLASMICVPAFFFLYIWRSDGSFSTRIRKSLHPSLKPIISPPAYEKE